MIDSHYPPAVQTTGYTWDGDIQEFNNLLPRSWQRGFYATIIFAVCYWLLYPAWPIGGSYTKGILNRLSYQSEGVTIRTHWNSRASLLHTLQKGVDTGARREYLQHLTATSYQEITENPELTAFSRSLAKRLFGDNCAPCHGNNAGFSTDFSTENRTWSRTFEQIERSIADGRWPEEVLPPTIRDTYTMHAWKGRLSIPEIKALTLFVYQHQK
ncbi:hypothetical protein CCP3SC15_4160002 [Gammaproteobacteria bacterium]